MGYCDFASIMAIIREYIGDGWEMTQPKLTNMIFGNFFEHVDYAMDNTQVNRWYTGSAQINSSIKEYYQGCKHRKELEKDINKNILPMLSDSAMVVEKLNDLVWND
ncbi:MAG: Archaeal ATPase, partial [Clostridia bacterium]|nr:Archaeal ATPase [Clostridia bacterium]